MADPQPDRLALAESHLCPRACGWQWKWCCLRFGFSLLLLNWTPYAWSIVWCYFSIWNWYFQIKPLPSLTSSVLTISSHSASVPSIIYAFIIFPKFLSHLSPKENLCRWFSLLRNIFYSYFESLIFQNFAFELICFYYVINTRERHVLAQDLLFWFNKQGPVFCMPFLKSFSNCCNKPSFLLLIFAI